jgi:competence protein ComFB
MLVHNLMEEIVKQCLKELIHTQEQLRDCDERMQCDIMAIALNHLPPRYVTSEQGETFVKTQARQVEPDVFRELSYAIEKVLNSSRKSSFRTEDKML